MPELLPRFYATLERMRDERRMLQILDEAGVVAQDVDLARKVLTRSADGHDPARLRGLPAIGRNVSGATRETDPVRALMAKESSQRLR